MREDPHSGSLTHVDGQLSHCPHLFNACASIQGAFQVAFKLSIDLCFMDEFHISIVYRLSRLSAAQFPV